MDKPVAEKATSSSSNNHDHDHPAKLKQPLCIEYLFQLYEAMFERTTSCTDLRLLHTLYSFTDIPLLIFHAWSISDK